MKLLQSREQLGEKSLLGGFRFWSRHHMMKEERHAEGLWCWYHWVLGWRGVEGANVVIYWPYKPSDNLRIRINYYVYDRLTAYIKGNMTAIIILACVMHLQKKVGRQKLLRHSDIYEWWREKKRVRNKLVHLRAIFFFLFSEKNLIREEERCRTTGRILNPQGRWTRKNFL